MDERQYLQDLGIKPDQNVQIRTWKNEVKTYSLSKLLKKYYAKQLSLHVVSNSTALEQLFNKCKQDDPTMTKEEFNRALDLWFYRWDKDQQIKQMISEQ